MKRVQEFMEYNENHKMQINHPIYLRDDLIIPVIQEKLTTIKTNPINIIVQNQNTQCQRVKKMQRNTYRIG